MKKILLLVMCMAIVFLNAGCQNAKTRAGEGALIGGVLGAAAGGIIGHQSHHAGEGVGIGVAAGAITGAIVGSQIEKPAQPAESVPAQQNVNPSQISIQQIASFAKQGVNEAVIIDKIRITNSKYNLTANDIAYLKQQGVSQNVINVMQGA